MEAKAGDGENNGDTESGDEGGKKKTPNHSRMLKSRLQKLVDKTDDECISHFYRLPCFNFDPFVDGLSLRNSRSSSARNRGPATTGRSRSLSISRIFLYVFPVANGQHHLTPSLQKKLKREEYHRAPTFPRMSSSSFRTRWDSTRKKVRPRRATLKVCFMEAAVHALWKAEPTAVVLLLSAYIRSPCAILTS